MTNTLCLVCRLFLSSSPLFFFFFLSLCFCSWALLLTHLAIFRRQPWKCFLDSFHGFIQKLVSFGFSFLLRQFHLSTSFESIWNLILSYQKKKRMKTWIKSGKIFQDRGAHAWELVTSGRIHSLARVAGCVVRLLSAGSTRRIRRKNYNRNPCCYRYFQRLRCLHFHPAPLKQPDRKAIDWIPCLAWSVLMATAALFFSWLTKASSFPPSLSNAGCTSVRDLRIRSVG